TFVSTTSVATIPIVVAVPANNGGKDSPRNRADIVLTSDLPSLVRAPAMTLPVAGSNTSPTALTATIAPTVMPSTLTAAVPIPLFIARDIPNNLPTVAPAPAPALPSAGAEVVAALHAL